MENLICDIIIIKKFEKTHSIFYFFSFTLNVQVEKKRTGGLGREVTEGVLVPREIGFYYN